MMTETEPTEEEVLEAVYTFTAEKIANGVSHEEITAMLVERGLDREDAEAVVSNVAEMRSATARESAARNMKLGALWCVGGILVTAVTYSAASGGAPTSSPGAPSSSAPFNSSTALPS